MIIDSHAHYSHGVFAKPFRYLKREQGQFAAAEGILQDLLQEMLEGDIGALVEPGVSLASCEAVLALCRQYPDRIFPAVGIHPTRSVFEKWADRKKLDALAAEPGVIAVGECGLDYHYKREEQHRLKQHLWFLYQLDLALRLKKPVILHIRDAHTHALRILKRHPAARLGGVVHCFTGDADIARQYVRLGYHIGIGGSILQPEERAGALWEAVREIPVDRILLETDAPFILPDCRDVIAPKIRRRLRNTSLILPAVIEKIALLKNMPPEEVERITAENAVKLFRLSLPEE